MRRKFFDSIRPGLPAFRFGYIADSIAMQFRTTTNALLTLKTSDGSVDSFRNEISKSFSDSSLKESTITVDDINTIDILNIRSPNILYVNGPTGTCDITAFPNLLIFSINAPLCNRYIGKIPLGVSIGHPNCAGKILDIAALDANEIRIDSSFCNDISWPVGADYVTLIQLGSHAISVAQVITNIPKLTYLYLDGNRQEPGHGMGRLDISNCLNLRLLSIRETKVNSIITVPGMSLEYLNCIFNDFTAIQSDQPGQPDTFASLVANSLKLNRVDGYNMGLSATLQIDIIDILINSDSSRVRCTLDLAYGNINAHYYSYIPNSNSRANEALVTQQAISKLNYLRSLGHSFTVNDYIFNATIISDTTLEITLANSDDDITAFGIGDTLNFVNVYSPTITSWGNHKVLSGSGKTWLVDNVKAEAGYIGFVTRVQVQAIV